MSILKSTSCADGVGIVNEDPDSCLEVLCLREGGLVCSLLNPNCKSSALGTLKIYSLDLAALPFEQSAKISDIIVFILHREQT